MRHAVIVEAVRTPVGRRNGVLSNVRAEDLAAEPLKALIQRTNIDPMLIDDVIYGCVTQSGEQGGDIARQAALIANYPTDVPGTTIDRQCGSSQQAVHFAAQAILSGDMDVVVAGGVESMTRVPMFSNRNNVNYSEKLTEKHAMIHQGLSAEMIAEKWGFSRKMMDEFSLQSHEKAIYAQKNDYFVDEIMPLNVDLEDGTKKVIKADEGPRKDTSIQALSELKPVFKENGGVTAGNASQMSDGAAALLMMSDKKAAELGFNPRFKITTRVVVGSDPTLMLTGPIPATKKALAKAHLSIHDIDIFEVNEAFASVPLAWLKETGADPQKLNPNGGAIALGHPLGASGARLMITMMYALERTGGKYGLQTMCEGFGMANATIIERID